MIGTVIDIIRKYRFRIRLRGFREYIADEDTIFLQEFRMTMHSPERGRKYLRIGKDSMLNCNIVFESVAGEVVIGDRVFIGASNIICRTKIEFGDDIFVAWGVYFYDHDSHSADYREREKDMARQITDYRKGHDFIESKDWSVVVSKPIKVCSHAWIGMNCIILKGITIGEGAIVGAGSVVTKDVLPWSVVAGNPAVVVKQNGIRK